MFLFTDTVSETPVGSSWQRLVRVPASLPSAISWKSTWRAPLVRSTMPSATCLDHCKASFGYGRSARLRFHGPKKPGSTRYRMLLHIKSPIRQIIHCSSMWIGRNASEACKNLIMSTDTPRRHVMLCVIRFGHRTFKHDATQHDGNTTYRMLGRHAALLLPPTTPTHGH